MYKIYTHALIIYIGYLFEIYQYNLIKNFILDYTK